MVRTQAVTTPVVVPGTTEFSRLCEDGGNELKALVYKYPLQSLVTFFVLSFLGLLLVLTFSIIPVIGGALLGAMAFAIGKTMASNCSVFWARVRYSLGELLIGTGDLQQIQHQIQTDSLNRLNPERSNLPTNSKV
jgi:hypothetical protein